MIQENTIPQNLNKLFSGYLTANDYEPYEVYEMLNFFSTEVKTEVKKELFSIVEKQLWSVEYYLRLTGFEMQSKKAMYLYLEGIYKFIFESGELPDITQFEE